jgi:hypothetical protein
VPRLPETFAKTKEKTCAIVVKTAVTAARMCAIGEKIGAMRSLTEDPETGAKMCATKGKMYATAVRM